MERMGVVVELSQPAKQGRVVSAGQGRPARQPREEVLIGKVHQPFEAAKIGIVQRLDGRIREPAQQQVHFADAAMPSSKTQTPPANIGVGKHEILVLSQPASGASSRSGRPYIAMGAACVMSAAAQIRDASR
jgi:hypothetical protein